MQKDLTDTPLDNSELKWFTDGSSYVKDGQRWAGAAVVDDWTDDMGRGPSPGYLSTKGRVNCPDSSIRESQRKKK